MSVRFGLILVCAAAPTGTRIACKVCKKQSEWDAIRQGSQQMGEEVQRRVAHNNGVGN